VLSTCHSINTEGLITHASKNKPEAWVNSRNQMLGKDNHEPIAQSVTWRDKFEHAVTFIMHLADMFAETGYEDVSTADVANRPEVVLEGTQEEEKVYYLPYDTQHEVYLEYKNYYEEAEECLTPADRKSCGITTFREAFSSLKHKIKLCTARGAFETCSICNNLNDMLKNTKLQWTQEQLTIVLKLKRLHLNQQAAERRDAMMRKLKAKTTFNKDSKY